LAQDNFKSKYTVSQERSVAQHWQGDKKHTRPLILRGAKITSARSASCSSWRGPGRKRRRRGRAEETVEEKKEIAEPGKEEVAVGDVAVGGGEARGGEARGGGGARGIWPRVYEILIERDILRLSESPRARLERATRRPYIK
jgi:hypothetical protein